MRRLLATIAVTLALTAPALAGERPRLVFGGLDGGEARTELFAKGAASLGTVADTVSPLLGTGRERLALGGYVAYDLSDYRFSSSLKSVGDGAVAADLSASTPTSLWGLAGVTQLRLGADWTRPTAFSLNASQPGLAGYEGYRPAGDLSLSLSWTRDVTPNLSLGGVATASRPLAQEHEPGGFSLGAGLGYRF